MPLLIAFLCIIAAAWVVIGFCALCMWISEWEDRINRRINAWVVRHSKAQ